MGCTVMRSLTARLTDQRGNVFREGRWLSTEHRRHPRRAAATVAEDDDLLAFVFVRMCLRVRPAPLVA
jgi:hypothetical protein